ncbi:MAG: DUF882 domain-containing protein [Hyphomicrobiaceae bacterium]|nr:DUF882 domain-containing protein [Hyphomicrobiaceae bacterium]
MIDVSSNRSLRPGGASSGARAAARGILPALAALALAFGAPAEVRADSGREWMDAFESPAPARTFSPPQKLGALSTADERPRRRRSNGVRVASLGPATAPIPQEDGGSAGAGIRWVANSGCLADSLRAVIAGVAASFGSVRISSTCRSHSHNRRVGGARRSYHLTGNAADFRVFGNVPATLAYLRGRVGGLKHYGGGLFHIDTGPRRQF